MRVAWVVALTLCAGCGRIGFDETSSVLGGGDAGVDCPTGTRVNHRSIGTHPGDLVRTTGNTIAGTCVVAVDAELPPELGPGDRVTVDGELAYIRAIPDKRTIALDQPIATTHANATIAAQRSFSDFATWETDRQGDLVADDRMEIGVAYADSVFIVTSSIDIEGSTTDAAHYMRITSAPTQRHRGRVGAGVVLDGTSVPCGGFNLTDDFVFLEHLELVRFDADVACGTAAVIVQGKFAMIRSLLVHDYVTTITNASSAIRLSNSGTPSATVENVIAFDGRNGARNPPNGGGTMTVRNCTFANMLENGVELGSNGGTMIVTNTLAFNNAQGDFQGNPTQAFNASSDASATGTSSLTGVTSAEVVSATDLHLAPAATVIGRGTDLSMFFTDDIDGAARGTVWDIGADQH